MRRKREGVVNGNKEAVGGSVSLPPIKVLNYWYAQSKRQDRNPPYQKPPSARGLHFDTLDKTFEDSHGRSLSGSGFQAKPSWRFLLK